MLHKFFRAILAGSRLGPLTPDYKQKERVYRNPSYYILILTEEKEGKLGLLMVLGEMRNKNLDFH
jgi:hypothetical protein